MAAALLGPVNPDNKAMTIVEIAPGTSFGEVARTLEERGLLRFDWSLKLLARFKKQDTRIKAGEYEFSQSMSPKEILAKLIAAKMLVRKVEVREGVTIQIIGKLVKEAGILEAEAFYQAARNPTLLAKAGLPAESFEGYLFPETYNFSKPITAEQVLWRMFSEGEKRWKPEYQAQADSLNLSRQEITTLASIIEKESGNRQEQPLVSSVFHNRMKLGMKLQSDPTVIYGLKDFNGNLTRADLQNPHIYNTYVNFGLPPAPIANPGESAIVAALYPAESAYLYFVGDNQGRHIFSKTLEEHNLAVLKYQKQGFGRGNSLEPQVPDKEAENKIVPIKEIQPEKEKTASKEKKSLLASSKKQIR